MSRYAPLALAATLALSAVASASVKDRLYDFTDDYYRANGVDPAKLGGRQQAPSATAVIDTPLLPSQRNVRITLTFGAYGANGSPSFFTVAAGLGPDGFTNDKAGQNARKIADSFAEYIFPMKGTDPTSLANRRQDMVLDTNGGYFGKDPLGLWLHVWVVYTDAAFTTKDGLKELDKVRKKNGNAKDGTPLLRTKSEIEGLAKKGFVSLLTRNDGLRYAVCPTMKDPRNGAIAPDAFLSYIKRDDGSPLDPTFLNSFTALQKTGDWPKKP